MKRKGHIFWTSIYIFIIAFFLEPLALMLIFIPIIMGISPDLDYGENHRFWLSHSIVLPLIAWLVYPHILTLLILLAIGHHLALDTVGNIIFGKEAKGYYTVCIIPTISFNFYFFKVKTKSYRINGRLTTWYLLINWIVSLIVLIIEVI